MLKRIILAVLAIVVVGAAGFLGPTLFGRPWMTDHFYTRVFVAFMLRHPMVATSAGMPFGADRIDDLSTAFTRREAIWVRQQLELLRSYDRKAMTPAQKLSRDVMEFFLVDQVDGEKFQFMDYPVNGFRGMQGALPEFMLTLHPMRKVADAKNYVKRVEALPLALDQVTAGVRERAANRVVPPRFVLEQVVAEIDTLLAPAPREHPLYHRLDVADTLRGLDASEHAKLCARTEQALANAVLPAYRRMRALCDSLRHTATEDAGVWKLADGDDYYSWQLRHHTTTTLPADTIHALGLAEVARDRALIAQLLRRTGLGSDLRAGIDALENDPRMHYADGPHVRDTVLAEYRAILDEAQRRLPELFGTLPHAELDVVRVPAFREPTSAAAYYQGPGLDRAAKGKFYVNTREPRETKRFDMRTLAYHEGVPGHHLQIATAAEATGLPLFRRLLPFTAFDEGWALYAERLAMERGFHKTAYDSIGALRADLFRAARLVVDTGLHHGRWTREQAVRYMVDEGLQTESLARTEVDRYIVNPGQACAYKIGQLEILELRQRAMDRLGPRFDLRAFHEVVLGNGALPLVLLERQVDEWIAREAGLGKPS